MWSVFERAVGAGGKRQPVGRVAALVIGAAGALASVCGAQPDEDLGRFFGFDEMRIIPVDEGCGPTISGDFNADGRPDLAVVNNRKSRIEVHYLRASERTESDRAKRAKANEVPPSPWYDREYVSVAHRVAALRPFDIDKDGRLDLIYAGANPSELVAMRQVSPSKFEVMSKRDVKDMSARQGGLEVADVMGDAAPELLVLAGDRVAVFPIGGEGVLGEPIRIGSVQLAALFIEDFDGDGMQDVLGVAPEDPTPLRLWLQGQDPRVAMKAGMLAAELRFESPGLREAEPVRFPGKDAASLGVIERASRRMVFYDLKFEGVPEGSADAVGAEREVRAAVWAFSDGSGKERSVEVADLNGDGRVDLLATDSKANTVVLYAQRQDVGLGSGEPFSAFKKPKSVAVGEWDGQGTPEVFVLSEEEKAAGVSTFDAATGRLSFPTPLPVKTAGASPVAMDFVALGERGALAVIVKDRRDHTLELHRPASSGVSGVGAIKDIKLEGVTRPPQSMLAADADQDGLTDLLLFTPSEPMVMVRTSAGDGVEGRAMEVLTDKTMPQFGLVQAAGPDNTALLDVNGDGKDELLIADENFVRACRYDVKAGWSVVEQVTMPEPGTQLVGLATLQDTSGVTIVAADKGNGRLLLISRLGEAGKEKWKVREQLRLRGFPLGAIYAGAFAGDGEQSVLCIGEDGFALVRLGGKRPGLEQFAAYRSESEDRSEHEMEPGDINGDGYVDVVVLDNADRMCILLTFSASRKVHLATEFEVFQSRLFNRGGSREGEPRDAMVADLTGDGKDDVLITVHDRLILYPQAAASSRAGPGDQ
ncbi:MAG: VCBS repeat-containing protein [Phycisphaerales bacterium]|nr:VCBS repeat-containing protein [Phycisphaerales bacterium]